jgi:pyruvate ferredoxin oxidoreductase delta subunit
MAKEKIKLNIGAVITQAGSSLKNKTGSWRILKPKILKSKCVGCGICANFCPDVAIKMKNKKASIDYNYCKGCGICAKECPAKAIIMGVEG